MTDAVGPELAAGVPEWDPDTDDMLVCRDVHAETHDVKTFTFSARTPRRFRYLPGQFVTFEVPLPGGTIQRCYTIASTPTRPFRVSCTIKRMPGGPVSTWMHEHMAPGVEIRARLPLGEFTTVGRPPAKYLFLSGGSGITPLMSMARAHHDLGLPADIVFVHSARSPADIIFRTELELMAHNMAGFRVVHVCESRAGEPGWAGLIGRLSLPMLRLIAPDLLERAVYACGPAPYRAAVRAMLAEAGHDPERYVEESFKFEELAEAAPPAEPVSAAGPVFRVEFTRSGRTIECDAGTHVLDAARLAGLRLPSSCTKGLCGTCKSKLVSGQVDMNHMGGIRQREIDQGQILICCSKPLSDLVIDR